MAIVHTSWSTAANTNWMQQTGSWIATDPAYQLHVELQAWISALNDPLVSILKTPNDSTSRAGSFVRWMIQLNTGIQDEKPYGMLYMSRPSNAAGQHSYEWNFYDHVNSTATNNYGTFSQQFSTGIYQNVLTQACTHDVFYQTSGNAPWFMYLRLTENTVYYDWMFKADRSAAAPGSYYPAEQSPMVLMRGWIGTSTHYSIQYCTAARDNYSPKKGAVLGRSYQWEYPTELLATYPWNINLFGHSHYIGAGPSEILLMANGQTEYGDTTIIGGREYMSARTLWLPLN